MLLVCMEKLWFSDEFCPTNATVGFSLFFDFCLLGDIEEGGVADLYWNCA